MYILADAELGGWSSGICERERVKKIDTLNFLVKQPSFHERGIQVV